ncbi:unnamed protein product [Moneuplotes crassus]|uniref:chitin synthase n=1 Tax=Euplotes crassus TaxID=5936 RepID=A0AAD1USB3_EUPCR|nr:unnamed protein product [Moneuplotes crassus]
MEPDIEVKRFEEQDYENKDDLSEIPKIEELDDYVKECTYTPLSLVNPIPFDPSNQEYIMREHILPADADWNEENPDANDIPIDSDGQYGNRSASSLLGYGIHKRRPKLLINITVYNEEPKQLVETLAGVYRNYYELIDLDPTFLNRVQVVIIVDGYSHLMKTPEHLLCYERANIHDLKKLSEGKYISNQLSSGFSEAKTVFQKLLFISSENMVSKERKILDEELKQELYKKGEKKKYDPIRAYGANNIAHCFSRVMSFEEWEQCLPKAQRDSLVIDQYEIYDFLVGSNEEGRVKDQKYGHFSLPIHFIVKQNSQGKLESRKWFMRGFCKLMNPIYLQTLDCGSIPLWNSISKIIMHMETFTDVGGACGEVECLLMEKKQNGIESVSFIESSILRAQYAEYKITHYMDKATESVFGFVNSLPGTFSTFRWESIKGKPLDQYLKGCTDQFSDIKGVPSCVSANKYLAEDRIISLEIIAKAHSSFITHYIPGAKCLTDPPLSLTELIKQRRRWFNGSLFATLHVMKSMYRIWGRKWTSFFRNLFYMLLAIYMVCYLILSYVTVGLFYAAFSVFLRGVLDSEPCYSLTESANIFENIYLIFLFFCLMLSTTVEVTYAEAGFRICSLVMSLFAIVTIVCSIFFALDGDQNRTAIILLGLVGISFIIPILLNIHRVKLADFVKGIFYGTILSPTYFNILPIFAISNIHDVSWGSRPTTKEQTKSTDPAYLKAIAKKDESYKNFRANFLIFWLSINGAVGITLTTISRNLGNEFIFLSGIVLSLLAVFKLVFSTIHKLLAWIHSFFVNRHIRNLRKRMKKDNIPSLHERVRNKDEDDICLIFEKFRPRTALDKEQDKQRKNELSDKVQAFAKNLASSICPEKREEEIKKFRDQSLASLGQDMKKKIDKQIRLLRKNGKSSGIDPTIKKKPTEIKKDAEYDPLMDSDDDKEDNKQEHEPNQFRHKKRYKNTEEEVEVIKEVEEEEEEEEKRGDKGGVEESEVRGQGEESERDTSEEGEEVEDIEFMSDEESSESERESGDEMEFGD